jgi:hypothetical protein
MATKASRAVSAFNVFRSASNSDIARRSWHFALCPEAFTCKPEQEAPDYAKAKFAREEPEVHDVGAAEAIQALDSVPLLHRQRTFVIRHHVCGADRQRWGRLQWGDGVRPD